MASSLVRNLFSLVQKRFLNASATAKPSPTRKSSSSSSSSSSFTVQFLVKSYGLPLESAVSVSKTFQLDEKNIQNHQSVINLLKSHNFSDAQMAKLIEKKPGILQCRVERNLLPKFNYLKENGFVGELLPDLIVSNPVILRRALNRQIKPCFAFLRTVIDSNEKLVKAMKRCSLLLTYNLKGIMEPNIDLLKKEGVPLHTILKFVPMHPRTMIQRPDRLDYAVKTVKNLGFQPTSGMFLKAVRVIVSLSESNWKKKMEMFKSVGWSEEEILAAFKKDPLCLSCSEKKFKESMDFFLNTAKVEPQVVLSYPKFLMHAVDTRLRPRYKVLQALESKKLIERNKKTLWLLTINEKSFQKNYIDKFAAEVPGLSEMYFGAGNIKRIDT